MGIKMINVKCPICKENTAMTIKYANIDYPKYVCTSCDELEMFADFCDTTEEANKMLEILYEAGENLNGQRGW